MKIYLDSAATTIPCEAAVSACFSCMTENFGNPSSLHGIGLAAEKTVTEARKAIAAALVCAPECITFTSGATESNNTVIMGAAEKWGRRKKKIVISAVEHPSVAAPVKYLGEHGFTVVRIPPMRSGERGFYLRRRRQHLSCLLYACEQRNGSCKPSKENIYRSKKKIPPVSYSLRRSAGIP